MQEEKQKQAKEEAGHNRKAKPSQRQRRRRWEANKSERRMVSVATLSYSAPALDGCVQMETDSSPQVEDTDIDMPELIDSDSEGDEEKTEVPPPPSASTRQWSERRSREEDN